MSGAGHTSSNNLGSRTNKLTHVKLLAYVPSKQAAVTLYDTAACAGGPGRLYAPTDDEERVEYGMTDLGQHNVYNNYV